MTIKSSKLREGRKLTGWYWADVSAMGDTSTGSVVHVIIMLNVLHVSHTRSDILIVLHIITPLGKQYSVYTNLVTFSLYQLYEH